MIPVPALTIRWPGTCFTFGYQFRAFFCFRICRGLRFAQPFLFSETVWATKQPAHIITRRISGINEDSHAYESAPREIFFLTYHWFCIHTSMRIFSPVTFFGSHPRLARGSVLSAQRRKMNVHDWVNGRHFFIGTTPGDHIWIGVGGPRVGLDTVNPALFGCLFSLFTRIKGRGASLVRDRAANAIHFLSKTYSVDEIQEILVYIHGSSIPV